MPSIASRFIAFDFGLKQIGLASGNRIMNTASPLCVIKARDGIPNWDELATLLNEWRPNELVVGLPLNMDGTDSELSRRATKFANRLRGRFNLTVHLVDERLTSFAAKEIAASQGHHGDYNDAPVDAFAAQLILEQFFAESTKAKMEETTPIVENNENTEAAK